MIVLYNTIDLKEIAELLRLGIERDRYIPGSQYYHIYDDKVNVKIKELVKEVDSFE